MGMFKSSTSRFAGLGEGHKGTVFSRERGGFEAGNTAHRSRRSGVKALSRRDHRQGLALKRESRKDLCIRGAKSKNVGISLR